MISPGASSEVSGVGELVECLGQDPVFGPVDPPRAVADGVRAGACVAAAVGGPAVDPVRLEASSAHSADQHADQSVAAFAVVVMGAGSVHGRGGEEVGVADQGPGAPGWWKPPNRTSGSIPGPGRDWSACCRARFPGGRCAAGSRSVGRCSADSPGWPRRSAASSMSRCGGGCGRDQRVGGGHAAVVECAGDAGGAGSGEALREDPSHLRGCGRVGIEAVRASSPAGVVAVRLGSGVDQPVAVRWPPSAEMPPAGVPVQTVDPLDRRHGWVRRAGSVSEWASEADGSEPEVTAVTVTRP